MIASKPELEQMAKDGKGRASVVKALAQAALESNGSLKLQELDPMIKSHIPTFMHGMVSEWPNTLEAIFVRAAEIAHGTQADAGIRAWWKKVRDALPAAAKEICRI